MSLFKHCLRQYIEHHIHVSLALISLVFLTYKYASLPIDWNYMGFAFFGTIVAYTYIKNVPAQVSLKSGVFLVLQRSPWWVHAMGIISVFFAVTLRVSQQLGLIIFMILSLAYILPIPFKIAPFRDYGAIKIIIVALVWSGISVLLPLLPLHHIYWEIVLLYLAQTLWIIVLTIPFEIRDSGKDVLRHPTWPQKLGLWRTKILGTVLLMICAVIHFNLSVGLEIESEQSITFWGSSFLFTLALTWLGLLVAETKQSYRYSAFWIEAIPIVWLLMRCFTGY